MPQEVAAAEASVRRAVTERLPVICAKIGAGESLNDIDREALLRIAREAMELLAEESGKVSCRLPTS